MTTSPEWLRLDQPPLPAGTVERSAGHVKRYRFMAFATGVALSIATVVLIMKLSGVPHMEPATTIVWSLHGWLYVFYVVATAMLGVRLRWPLPRYAVVMAAGMVPTMSFVAEHYVTRAARSAQRQSVPVAD